VEVWCAQTEKGFEVQKTIIGELYDMAEAVEVN
jgi:hypothetical protein